MKTIPVSEEVYHELLILQGLLKENKWDNLMRKVVNIVKEYVYNESVKKAIDEGNYKKLKECIELAILESCKKTS